MDLASARPVVLETLERACSQHAAILKEAEQQLKQWEAQSGFYTILLSIFSDYEIAVNVRWLAVLYFKNGVDRYWRKTAPNAISEEEKVHLRQKLIADFGEPVNQIAVQLGVLIAKIARLDCPRNWPELIPLLLQAIKSDVPLYQQRALLVFHHVIKTLASRRLAHDRKVFEELTSNVFNYMLELWCNHTESFFRMLNSSPLDGTAVLILIDHSILTLKVLRKLSVYGIPNLRQNDQAVMFVNALFQRVHDFLKSKPVIAQLGDECLMRREKVITLLTKNLLDIQEYHPESYVQFIRPTLELAVQYNFTSQGQGLCYERFCVNSLNLMRSVLRCEVYRPAKTIEETKNPLTLEAYKIKTAFFTHDTLTEITRQLILKYFLLTQEDLEVWDSAPEEFIADEGGDSWKFTLKPCTENLYLTIFKEYRQHLTPVVLNIVKEHQGAIDPSNIQAVLIKDAVYNAVGQASFDLYDDVDFDSWFTNHLLQELQNPHPNYRIIRRRVVWLTGCWVGVKMSHHLRPTLYEVILKLLEPPEDLVVRIAAASTLQNTVDDFEFRTEGFLPFLEAIFKSLFQLLKDVNECETKMQVLHVMSFVIERVGAEVRPHATGLLGYLPLLWDESADHMMLRCAILTTLSNLVQGLGILSVNMYGFLLPVIQLSTDVKQDAHVYLLEDGLDLWEMTLHCSPAMTPDMMTLFENMDGLLDSGTENMRICLKIIEAYLLLGGKLFMEKYSEMLVNCILSLMTDLRSEGIIMVLKLVETVIKLFPEEGPVTFSQLLIKVLESAFDDELYTVETAIHLSLLARISLQNQQFFLEFIESVARNNNQLSSDILGHLMDTWVDKFDNIIQPERRKLCSLALTSLLGANIGCVMERVDGIINVVVETLHDITREEENSLIDVLVVGNSPLENEDDSEHEKRYRHLSHIDPVHTVVLRDYVRSELNRCQQTLGETAFHQLMDSIDCEITKQLQYFLQES